MGRGCWRGGKGWVSAGSGAVCVEPCLAHFGRQPAWFGNDNVIGTGPRSRRPWGRGAGGRPGGLGGCGGAIGGQPVRWSPIFGRRLGSGRSIPGTGCGSHRTRWGCWANGSGIRRSVGHQRRPDSVLLEDLGVAVFDDHRGAGQGGQFAEGVSEPPAGKAGDEVGIDLRSTAATRIPSMTMP